MPAESQFKRLMVSNPTASATALAPGVYASRAALTTALGYTPTLINMRCEAPHEIRDQRYKGVEIIGMGVGADNSTIKHYIWRVMTIQIDESPQTSSAFYLQYLGLATLTLGTLFGTLTSANPPYNSTGGVTTAERHADTITFASSTTSTTPKGPFNVYTQAFRAADPSSSTAYDVQPYSPADNTFGSYVIPDVFNANFLLIEPIVGTATSANACYCLHT